MVPPKANGGTTYWVAILFHDQNSDNTQLHIEVSDILFSGAERHAVFMSNDVLNRAWCCREVVARMLAVVGNLERAEAMDRTDAILRVGEMTEQGDAACTTFVIVRGRTDLFADVHGGAASSRRFDGMRADREAERAALRALIAEDMGSAEAFNFAMIVLRNAVLKQHARTHQASSPRRRPPPTATEGALHNAPFTSLARGGTPGGLRRRGRPPVPSPAQRAGSVRP
jgi:hypothetical protein